MSYPIPHPGMVSIVIVSDDGKKFATQEVQRTLLEDEEAVAWAIKEILRVLDEKLTELGDPNA